MVLQKAGIKPLANANFAERSLLLAIALKLRMLSTKTLTFTLYIAMPSWA